MAYDLSVSLSHARGVLTAKGYINRSPLNIDREQVELLRDQWIMKLGMDSPVYLTLHTRGDGAIVVPCKVLQESVISISVVRSAP